jgi:hypothetical protein
MARESLHACYGLGGKRQRRMTKKVEDFGGTEPFATVARGSLLPTVRRTARSRAGPNDFDGLRC